MIKEFTVIDNNTGKQADLVEIALTFAKSVKRSQTQIRTSFGSLHGRISRRTKRSSAVFRCGSALLVGE